MVRMVLQRRSNGLETRIEGFGNADRMVLQRGLNGLEAQIKWFLQRGSNSLETRIERFCNCRLNGLATHASNGFATRIE